MPSLRLFYFPLSEWGLSFGHQAHPLSSSQCGRQEKTVNGRAGWSSMMRLSPQIRGGLPSEEQGLLYAFSKQSIFTSWWCEAHTRLIPTCRYPLLRRRIDIMRYAVSTDCSRVRHRGDFGAYFFADWNLKAISATSL